MNERAKRFPQVLLLGNGINRLSGSSDWKQLIGKINTNARLNPEDKEQFDIPYPLLAVLAADGDVDNAVKSHLELFGGLYDGELDKIRPYLSRLLSLGFDDILTTNYSYELERVAYPKITRGGKGCRGIMKHTAPVKRAEPKYLLHTYSEVKYGEAVNRVWHIHGEVRKPNSIVLGHYNYGSLLRRMQDVLGSRENVQYRLEMANRPPVMDSWLDAFIMGDVYILGFGFDFSEFDLWWLLERKKREKASHGIVRFYSPTHGNDFKLMMMETYGAEIISFGFTRPKPDYEGFYNKAIEDIFAKFGDKKV